MTAFQQKAYLFLISKIKPEDEGGKNYEFSVTDFLQACGLEQSGKNYIKVKETIRSIRNISFWVTLDGKEHLLGLLDRATIEPKTGKITCCFHDDIKPFLLYLKENYTQFELRNVLAMQSKYAIRFYELAKSHQFLREFQIPLDELKRSLCAENYEDYRAFRRRVLDPALEEINLLTDINLAVTETKGEGRGSKVTGLTFCVTPKDYDEQWLAEKERERIYGKNAETDRG
jgi:plasmid replication initiation protein